MSWLLLLFVMLLALLLMLLLCSWCSYWFVDYDAVDDCVIVGYEFAVVVGCDVPDVLHLCCIMIWNVRVVVYVYICWRSILLRYWEFIRSQNILAMVLLNFESSCFSLLLNLLFSFRFIVLYSHFAMKYLSLFGFHYQVSLFISASLFWFRYQVSLFKSASFDLYLITK